MALIQPLTKKQRAQLKNRKYYEKKKAEIKKSNFLRRLKSMATSKPHWKCMHAYGITYKILEDMKNEKWGENPSRDEFFTSLLLYCRMKDQETKKPLPQF